LNYTRIRNCEIIGTKMIVYYFVNLVNMYFQFLKGVS